MLFSKLIFSSTSSNVWCFWFGRNPYVFLLFFESWWYDLTNLFKVNVFQSKKTFLKEKKVSKCQTFFEAEQSQVKTTSGYKNDTFRTFSVSALSRSMPYHLCNVQKRKRFPSLEQRAKVSSFHLVYRVSILHKTLSFYFLQKQPL